MNTKLLVGLGAAGILAVGACFGGVMYTKSTAHSKMRTTGYQIEDMFRAVGHPVDIRTTGTESTGLFSDVTSYEISFVDGNGSALPLKVINSYGIGTVESTFDLDDAFYQKYNIAGRNAGTLKAMFNGFRMKYSTFSDKLETNINIKDGSIDLDEVDISWKQGSAEFLTVDLSKNPRVPKSSVDFPEFIISDKNNSPIFKLVGLKSDSGPSSGNAYHANFEVKEYFSKFGNTSVEMGNVKSLGNFGGGSGLSKFILNFGMDISVDSLKLDSNEEERHLDIKDSKLKIGFNDFDFTALAKKCECKDIEDLSGKMQKCLSTLDPREQMKLSLSIFGKSTSIEANLNSVLNGAKVDLKNKFYLDAAVSDDLSNPLVFISSILLNGMYHVDSALFSMPEYQLEKYADLLKSYARDPEAETLEYHIEYRKGILSVNGKRLDL